MSTSNTFKGKRSIRITLGWFAGAHAFSGVTIVPGGTAFVVTSRTGDWSASHPKDTIADPLDQGQVDLTAAPVLVDHQNDSGSFSVNKKFETDAVILGILDILYQDGAASALPSVIDCSQEVYCDMLVEWIVPGCDSHFRTYGQVRLTHEESMGDSSTIAISWESREGFYERG